MSKRVILAVPENNTTLCREIAADCPDFGEIALARVPRPGHTMRPEDYPQYRERTLETVRPLIGNGADLVIFGCTGAGFMAGPAGNLAFMDALGALTGSPVVSTADSMVRVLRHKQIESLDLLSPYVSWKNDRLIAYLHDYDISVQNTGSFEAGTPAQLAAISSDAVLHRALDIARDAEALFIACTQLPTRAILPELGSRLKRPAWSAARATAWDALGALGLSRDHLE